MKIAIIIVRVLLGLLFVFASVTYFISTQRPETFGNTKIMMDGFEASGYILPVAKIVELLAALAFLSGRFVTLGLVLLAPIFVNIFLINALHMRDGLPVVIPILLALLFLAYTEREKFQPLFTAK